MDEQNYYDMSQDPTAGLENAALQPYQSPAAAELAGMVYGNPARPVYGNEQAAMTDMRASYGAPSALAYGVAAGTQTVVGGAYSGASRMLSDIGGMIRPITYTPPARVYVGYSGRVMQETGIYSSAKAMAGFGEPPRSTSPYLYQMNAAEDLGERVGMGMGGLAVSLGAMGVSGLGAKVGARLGGAGFMGSILGGAGSIVGGLGAYQAAAMVGEGIYEGVAARQDVQNYLGRTSSQYVTSGSRDVDQTRGGGFSRAARKEIGEYIRNIDIKDPMLGTEDLQTILKGSSELGMFAGVREVADFKKKFKSIVDNVKTVTVTLNQTLEEGLQTMKDLKGVGIDVGHAGEAVLRAQSMGRVAGRSAAEMVNIGLQGAEMFRGTGVEMGIGFQSNIMNLASVRASRDAKLISQEAIAQAGGEEALAQRMTGRGLSFVQSSIGRAAGAAYFQQGQGFSPEAFADALNSKEGMSGLAQKAAHALNNPVKILEYEANQAKFNTELGKAAGGKGLEISMLSTFVDEANTISKLNHLTSAKDKEMVLHRVMLGHELSESEITAFTAEIKNRQANFDDSQKALQSTVLQQKMDQSINNMFFSRWGAQTGDWAKKGYDFLGGRAINAGAGYVADAFERTKEGMLGIDRWTAAGTGIAASDIAESFSFARLRKRDDFSHTGLRGEDLSSNAFLGFFSPTTAAMTLTDSMNDPLTKKMLEQAGLTFKTLPASRKGELDVVTAHGGGALTGATVTGLVGDLQGGLMKMAQNAVVSPEQAKRMDEGKLLSAQLAKIDAGVSKGADYGKADSMDAYTEMFFGHKNPSVEEQAALFTRFGGNDKFKDIYTATSNNARTAAEFLEQLQTAKLKGITDSLRSDYGVLSERFGGIKDENALNYFTQAMDAVGPARDKLIEEGMKAATAAGEAGSIDAKLIRHEVSSPTMGVKGLVEGSGALSARIRGNQTSSQLIREDIGNARAYEATRVEVMGNDKLDSVTKASTLDIAKKASTSEGFLALASTPTAQYKENQATLLKTESGRVLADRFNEYRAADILQGMPGANAMSQRRSLEESGIANIDTMLKHYSTDGVVKMQEGAVGANRALGGSSGAAVVGGAGGLNAASPEENMAIQTNTNRAILVALEAVARKMEGTGR